jgi:hypothetical protein
MLRNTHDFKKSGRSRRITAVCMIWLMYSCIDLV